MKAFVTGSRAYGTATPDSDFDLCVFMDEDTLEQLTQEFGFPIKIGNLNIIPCTSEDEMIAWKMATIECSAYKSSVAPLTKLGAISIHEKWRGRCDIPERDMGGSGKSKEIQDELDGLCEARNFS